MRILLTASLMACAVALAGPVTAEIVLPVEKAPYHRPVFRNDLVLVLTNSGQTDELKELLPHVRRIGATILTITGDTDCCHKNYYVYRDTEGTGEWQGLPWDVDLSFGEEMAAPLLVWTLWGH